MTDAKVMRTKDGASRKFGFVGFRTAGDAAAAREYYARSFIDTWRIAMEEARPIGDDSLDRPWSRHSKGSPAWVRAHPEEQAPAPAAAASKRGRGGEAEERRARYEEMMREKEKKRREKEVSAARSKEARSAYQQSHHGQPGHQAAPAAAPPSGASSSSAPGAPAGRRGYTQGRGA